MASMKLYRPTPEIVAFVAKNLRTADKREVRAMTGRPPLDVLLEGVDRSHESYVIVTPEKSIPAAIFGVVPLLRTENEIDRAGGGCLWMLGTDDVVKHAMHFHRKMWGSLEMLNRKWGTLSNVVDARNKAHINWLRHAGFKFGRPVIAGIEQRPFVPFQRTHPLCVPHSPS